MNLTLNCQVTASSQCDIQVHDRMHPLAVLVWFTPNFLSMYAMVTYYVFRRDLTCAKGNLSISATHFSDSSNCRTTRGHNNDRKLRPRKIIQQDDGEQYETRNYIIRIFRLLQSLQGEPTPRGVPYVGGPLTVNASSRIISERPSLILSSRLHRVLPQWSLPITCSHQQQCPI
jgi:hypothetical protein